MATEAKKLKALTLEDPRCSVEEANEDADEDDEGEEDEEREVEDLEREVIEMAEKILHYRQTIPGHLAEALSSSLVAQRPALPANLVDPGEESAEGRGLSSGERNPPESSNGGASISESDQEMLEKLRVFRTKTSANMEALPNVLKRMNECIARMDRVSRYNVNIHSVFKKKRRM